MRRQAFQAKDGKVVAAFLKRRRAAGPAQPNRLWPSWRKWGAETPDAQRT